MRFFAYQGTDRQGQPTQGTIQAPNADEAGRLLLGGGVRAASIRELGVASPVAPVSAPRSVSVPVPVSHPVPAPAVATAPVVRTRDAGDKTSFFFFDALGRLLQSGIAPNRALEELGRQARKPWLGERLLNASVAVGKGTSLADALDACACFPTGAVGTIRAGEASGSVPDACVQAAAGCEQAHRLGSRCAAMTIMFFAVALYFPFGLATVHGSVDAMEAQGDANGSLPIAATAARSVGAQLRHILPLAIPFWIVLFGAWRLWLTPRLRRARHRAALLVPILSGRAREESLARASWALTELSRAGVTPGQAMFLAAEACPNLVIADRFREEANRMREGTPLSAAMRGTGLISPQLVDVVENGELAGDVPGAVNQVHRATLNEYERKDATAHARIWFVLYPILGIIVGVIVASFAKTIFQGEIHAMLKDT